MRIFLTRPADDEDEESEEPGAHRILLVGLLLHGIVHALDLNKTTIKLKFVLTTDLTTFPLLVMFLEAFSLASFIL